MLSTHPPDQTPSYRIIDTILLKSLRRPYIMRLKHVPSEQEVTAHADIADLEIADNGVRYSRDSRSFAPEFPITSLHSTYTTKIQGGVETSNELGSERSYIVVDDDDEPQPYQAKAKTACLRCRGKKSRCSGKRPCGGCNNDGLDCLWDDDEATPKRSGRKTKSAERKRKAAKAKDVPLQVRSACTRCQHRKAKCSGSRPSCAYCVERHLECTYNVAEGETRTNDLKRRLRDSEIKTQAFGRILAVMREGNIFQATEVLARLRMGETPRDVLQSLPASIASPSPNFEIDQSELDRRLSA